MRKACGCDPFLVPYLRNKTFFWLSFKNLKQKGRIGTGIVKLFLMVQYYKFNLKTDSLNSCGKYSFPFLFLYLFSAN